MKKFCEKFFFTSLCGSVRCGAGVDEIKWCGVRCRTEWKILRNVVQEIKSTTVYCLKIISWSYKMPREIVIKNFCVRFSPRAQQQDPLACLAGQMLKAKNERLNWDYPLYFWKGSFLKTLKRVIISIMSKTC